MKKVNSIRLIALDLDGTLLNEKFELTEEVRASVKRVQDKGILIAVATGRDKKSADPFLQALQADRFAITSGGALIWIDGQVIKQNSLTDTQVINILNLGKEYQTGIFVDQPERSWRFGNKIYIDMYSHVGNMSLNYQIESILDPLPIKVTLIQEHGTLIEIRQRLADQNPELNMVFSAENILDLSPYGTNKGSALARLAQALRIRTTEVASVGDSENDVSMFLISGVSFAMGNAPKQVQQLANFIMPRNDQNGVVNAIESILKITERSE